MIIDTSTQYKGRCPLCSANLVLSGTTLSCGKHYKIKQTDFELAWDKYEKGELDALELLKELIAKRIPNEPAK